jgi:hypothetical protein
MFSDDIFHLSVKFGLMDNVRNRLMARFLFLTRKGGK